MKKLFICAVVTFALLDVPRAAAADAPKKRWKNVTEASLISTNGNTKSTTYSAKNTYNYDWTKTGLELIGGALGSKNNTQTTAEQYYGSEKVSYKVTDRNYAFEKFGWIKDRFAGIRNRYDATVGLGRELVKTEKDLLIGELGGGYISEERTNAPTNKFPTGRAYSKYTHTFTPTATVSQDVEYLHNFDDPEDFRVNAETALISALSVHFSLKIGYKWLYVGEPPPGFKRNDTVTSVALLASY